MPDQQLSAIDQEISLLISAKFPIIYILSYEERRVLAQLEEVRKDVTAHDLRTKEFRDAPGVEQEQWQKN